MSLSVSISASVKSFRRASSLLEIASYQIDTLKHLRHLIIFVFFRWLKKSFVPFMDRFFCEAVCSFFVFLFFFFPKGRDHIWKISLLKLESSCIKHYDSQKTMRTRGRLEPATCKRPSGLWPSAERSCPPLLHLKGSTEQDARKRYPS